MRWAANLHRRGVDTPQRHSTLLQQPSFPSRISGNDPRWAWLAATLALCILPRVVHAQDTEPEPPLPEPPPAQHPEETQSASRSEKEAEANKLVVPPARATPIKKPREVNALPLVSTNAAPPLIWKWPNFSTGDFVVTVGGRREMARMGPHGDWLQWEFQCNGR